MIAIIIVIISIIVIVVIVIVVIVIIVTAGARVESSDPRLSSFRPTGAALAHPEARAGGWEPKLHRDNDRNKLTNETS